MDAPTPGFNSAPTPGNLDQPTPGYGQYRTPAAAPTPGGFPETPGAWNAETPAADNGPSYD
jgi:transcription elongation factor SPT5